MGTWEFVVADPDFRTNKVGARIGKATKRYGVRGDREGREVFFGEFYKLLVVNTTCTNQDHTISGVVGLDIIREIITLDGQNVCFGAENCPAKGLACGMLAKELRRRGMI